MLRFLEILKEQCAGGAIARATNAMLASRETNLRIGHTAAMAFLVIVTHFHQPAALGQAFEREFGSWFYANAYSVEPTSDGGYITAGTSFGFGFHGAMGHVVKFDHDGVVQWTQCLGGTSVGADATAHSVRPTRDGGYIVAGTWNDQADHSFDLALMKLNPNGTIAWQKRYPGIGIVSEEPDREPRVRQTLDDGYIVVANYAPYPSAWHAGLLMRTDPNGNIIFLKIYHDDFTSPTQMSFSDVVIEPTTGNFFVLGDGPRLIRIANGGNLVRAITYDVGLPGATGAALAISPDAPPDLAILGSDSGSIGYLLRTDILGAPKWCQWMGPVMLGTRLPDEASLRWTADGGLVFSGVDPTAAYRAALVKADGAGMIAWARTYGVPGRNAAANWAVPAPGDTFILAGEIDAAASGLGAYLVKTDSLAHTCDDLAFNLQQLPATSVPTDVTMQTQDLSGSLNIVSEACGTSEYVHCFKPDCLQESLTFHSGNGSVGGPDALVFYSVNVPSGPFSAGHLSAATPGGGGMPAAIVTPDPGWVDPLPCDVTAQWVSVDQTLGPKSAIYSVPFTINSLAAKARVTLDFCFAADNALGDTQVTYPQYNPFGLYLIDKYGTVQALPGTQTLGQNNFGAQTQWWDLDITAWVTPGLNYLYIYNRDYGVVSGVIFKGRVNVTCDEVLWDQCSDLSTRNFIDQQFNDDPAYSTYQVHDISVPPGGWKVYTIKEYFTDGFGSWPIGPALARLNVYDKVAGLPLPGNDPAAGTAVPVTISLFAPGALEVRADLADPLCLPTGDYWIGLTPTLPFVPYGQEFHLLANTAKLDPSAVRNPGNGFGFGDQWDTYALFGEEEGDGSICLEGVSGCIGTIWDQCDPAGTPPAWIDQEFVTDPAPKSSTYQVHDCDLPPTYFGWNVYVVKTYFTQSSGTWPSAGVARFNVFDKTAALPSSLNDWPDLGEIVPVTLTSLGGNTWEVRADFSASPRFLSPDDYWIGLTPVIEHLLFGQEFHWLSVPQELDPTAVRNPGGGLSLPIGTDWGTYATAFRDFGGYDADGAICIEGTPVRDPQLLPGDLNCDGKVDFGDINPFILALSNPAGWEARYPDCNLLNGDINEDGKVDFGDINPFVDLLTAPEAR